MLTSVKSRVNPLVKCDHMYYPPFPFSSSISFSHSLASSTSHVTLMSQSVMMQHRVQTINWWRSSEWLFFSIFWIRLFVFNHIFVHKCCRQLMVAIKRLYILLFLTLPNHQKGATHACKNASSYSATSMRETNTQNTVGPGCLRYWRIFRCFSFCCRKMMRVSMSCT